jgi:hypothetical protein
MQRAVIFLISSAILIVMVSYFSTSFLPNDPFGDAHGSPTFPADGISQSKFAKMKLRHADLSPNRYDVGIFGNSRALNVSAQDIDQDGCRLFNFSIAGESLRGSAALIEQLGAIKKVPRVIVVSVDHFELQMYNNPFFLSAGARLTNFFDDLDAAITSGSGFREITTVLWRAAWTQALAFQRMFEYAFLANSLSSIFVFESDQTDAANVYRSDGSRRSNIASTNIPPVLSATNAQILPWQLKHDLGRIAAAKSAGVETIILYESFLHPTSSKYFDDNPSAHATRSREALLSTCEELGMKCITSKPKMDPEMSWSDASHPPRSVLGPYISELIAPYTPVCRS